MLINWFDQTYVKLLSFPPNPGLSRTLGLSQQKTSPQGPHPQNQITQGETLVNCPTTLLTPPHEFFLALLALP